MRATTSVFLSLLLGMFSLGAFATPTTSSSGQDGTAAYNDVALGQDVDQVIPSLPPADGTEIETTDHGQTADGKTVQTVTITTQSSSTTAAPASGGATQNITQQITLVVVDGKIVAKELTRTTEDISRGGDNRISNTTLLDSESDSEVVEKIPNMVLASVNQKLDKKLGAAAAGNGNGGVSGFRLSGLLPPFSPATRFGPYGTVTIN